MPILKLEIFQNSKSQKCKLWGRPPPLFGKSLHFDFFFFLMASLRMQFSIILLFRNNLVLLPLKNRDSEVSEYV